MQAEAFALLSEEGVAKGTRRIVAVTRGEAAKALAEAARLAAELAAVTALPDADLDKAVKAFKEVRWGRAGAARRGRGKAGRMRWCGAGAGTGSDAGAGCVDGGVAGCLVEAAAQRVPTGITCINTQR